MLELIKSSNLHTKAEVVEVKVVESNDERNEFFFPGFIGRFYLPADHLRELTM